MVALPKPSSTLVWIKSSASRQEECVEVAFSGRSVLIRDSRHPSGGAVVLEVGQWVAMLESARTGGLDMSGY
ncbi:MULTISPECIES: DUF397 domain-containing protein [Actinomadura]|uniref:DUF397 domain-containing protein n=1 Tax=Actinomadura TaxID=1988 RepID=UPI000944034F